MSAAPAAAQPTPAPAVAIDGPTPSIAHPADLGLSVARDGTGGLVYLKQVSGVDHVFVSRLLGGIFQPPQQVDGALQGHSSQPVIAAGNGGVLLVGFINGGALYAVDWGSGGSGPSAPIGLALQARNPSIQMTNFGKAYLAFTVPDGGGSDIRAAYYYAGGWSLESAPLNAVPGDDAGGGSGRPRVAAAGDGVAIVVWGESGHVFSRRVWGTAPSIVFEQADGPLPGCTESSADTPVVGAGGDSSYAQVAFDEQLFCGAGAESRVLMNRLHGSVYDGLTQPDGLSGPGLEGADQPQIAIGEYGSGFVTSARTGSGDLIATDLGSNGSTEGISQVNGLANVSAPYGVPAIAGLFSDLIAWQHDPGILGPREIRVRYAPSNGSLGPELVVSSPGFGPTDAANGIAAAGDAAGEGAIAWLQGSGSGTRVLAAQLYQAPGSFAARHSMQYARSAHPVLSWSAPRAPWGPIRFTVTLDGIPVAQAGGTSVAIPGAVPDGPHTWRVTSSDPAGLTSSTKAARVFVDTVRPRARLTASGARRVGSAIRTDFTYRDLPPRGKPARDASGVAKLVLEWGDGTVLRVHLGAHRELHVYRRPGRYRVALFVTDKAGNTTELVTTLKIARTGATSPAPRRRRGR
jgi:hypothetical protein